MLHYLGCFFLTVALELAVVWLMLRPCSVRRLALVVLLLNGVTHPILWVVVGQQFDHYWSSLLVGEVAVFAVETGLGLILFSKLGVPKARAVLVVLAANLLSFSFTFVV
jgi:hypothetical protein